MSTTPLPTLTMETRQLNGATLEEALRHAQEIAASEGLFIKCIETNFYTRYAARTTRWSDTETKLDYDSEVAMPWNAVFVKLQKPSPPQSQKNA